MDEPHTPPMSRRFGSRSLLDAITQAPDAWTGEAVQAGDAGDVDATFRTFDSDTAPRAGLAPLDDVDFGDFLPGDEFPVPRAAPDEDDIEALAEAALAGQTLLIDANGNTVLEPIAPRSLPVELPPQPTVTVEQQLPTEEDCSFDLDASLRACRPPTSSVEPLPEVIEGDTFEVRWSGQDNQGRAEGVIFDVFVAIDDGPFEVWLEATPRTGGLFHGEAGRHYAFFSVAIDGAGQREPLPEAAQAVVRLATPARQAPLLQPERLRPLQPIEVNTFNAEGERVADFLADAATSEADCGVAVVGLSGTADGRWEYSIDGVNWLPLTGVYHGSARLLRPEDRVRFLPRPFFSGSVRLTFRAWDQSSGAPGGLASLARRSAVGEGTAFSASLAATSLTVVKSATPSYRTDPVPALVAGGPRGCLVSRLTGASGAGQTTGVAVVSLTGTADGRWQFSLDAGRTWRDFGSVFRGRSRLLRGEDRIRFTPHGGFRGPARMIYQGWDGHDGVGGDTRDLLRTRVAGSVTQSASWIL